MLRTIGSLCSKIGSGVTPRGGSEVYSEAGVALIRSQNVLDLDFTRQGLAFIDEKTAESMKGVEVQSGDILLNITGDSVARVCMVPDEVLPARVNQHVMIIRSNGEVEPLYLLCYFILNKQALLNMASSGATRKALTKQQIEQMQIDITSKDIQMSVCNFMATIQSSIDCLSRINDNLLEQKHATFKRLWESIQAFDQAPLHTIAYLQKKTWKPSDRQEIIEHYSIPAFDEKCFPSFDESSRIQSNKTIVEPDSILVSKLNPETKRVWRPLCMTQNAVCSTEFLSIIPKEKAYSQYVYAVIDSDAYNDYLVNNATGSTGSRQRVLPETAMRFELPIPDKSAVKAFSEYAETVDRIVRNNLITVHSLIGLRDFLLPKLMSGEIDVSTLEILN